MRGEPVDDEVAAGRPGWGSLLFDLVVGAVLFVAVTVGFSPWYSDRLFDRGVFRAYYDQGVYQFRILGPDVVLWIDRVIPNDPLGSHLVANGRHPHAADLFTALFVLNAVSFVALVVLIHVVVRRGGLVEPGRSLVVVLLLVAVALSLSTVTPYDLPALALALAVLVAAGSRPPWDLLAVPLIVLGVLTRESALVAVAALAAHAVVVPPSRRRLVLIVVTGVAGVAAYLGVRVGASSPAFWETLTIEGNLARLIQWVGLAVMAGLYLVWRRGSALAGLGGGGSGRAVGWFWLFASPYVLTAFLTGYWFELRLLVPMLVGELWVRAEVARHPHETESVQSSRPPLGSLTSRSRSSTVSTPADSS